MPSTVLAVPSRRSKECSGSVADHYGALLDEVPVGPPNGVARDIKLRHQFCLTRKLVTRGELASADPTTQSGRNLLVRRCKRSPVLRSPHNPSTLTWHNLD